MIFHYKGAFATDVFQASPDALYIRYGVGFFETLYYNGHMLRHLDAHLERLFRSLEHFQIAFAKAPHEEIVSALLQRNGLAGKTARVDIFYPVADFEEKAQPLIQVSPWRPDPSRAHSLIPYPWRHDSHLSGHKSMSHMHHVLAKRHARQQDCDDALLTDFSGQVLETSACALLFFDGANYFSPESGNMPESVALARAAGTLPIRRKPIRLADLTEFQHAYVLNSLIGMRPVWRIGEIIYETDEKSCELATLRIL